MTAAHRETLLALGAIDRWGSTWAGPGVDRLRGAPRCPKMRSNTHQTTPVSHTEADADRAYQGACCQQQARESPGHLERMVGQRDVCRLRCQAQPDRRSPHDGGAVERAPTSTPAPSEQPGSTSGPESPASCTTACARRCTPSPSAPFALKPSSIDTTPTTWTTSWAMCCSSPPRGNPSYVR